MDIMKKIVKKQAVILLAMLIMISIMVSSVMILSLADTVPTFTVSDAAGAPGEEVTVKIECSGNTALTGWKIGITYDQSALELVTSDLEGVFAATTDGNPAEVPYIISWVNSLKNVDVNGKMAEITFKIKSNANNGDYPITLEYKEKEVFKLNETDKTQFDFVHFNVKNGTVKVTAKAESDTSNNTSSNTTSSDTSSNTTSSDISSNTTSSDISSDTSSNTTSSGISSNTSSQITSSNKSSNTSSTAGGTTGNKTESNSSVGKVSSTTSNTSNNGTTSPKTGVTIPFFGAVIVLLISAATISLFSKHGVDK